MPPDVLMLHVQQPHFHSRTSSGSQFAYPQSSGIDTLIPSFENYRAAGTVSATARAGSGQRTIDTFGPGGNVYNGVDLYSSAEIGAADMNGSYTNYPVSANGYGQPQQHTSQHSSQHPQQLDKRQTAMAFAMSTLQNRHNQPSRTSSRPASPVKFANPIPHDSAVSSRGSGHHAVASYLHLPQEIAQGRHGSLAEFAAQITCLFWFESTSVLQAVEKAPECPAPAKRLAADAFPSTGFLKWVTTILTTTQVANNVVLLALMFIYRLKKQNPQVQGKAGSEYRLLTVALMLGNKFLDDNTYTNKTWAEVSGISVYEIHVMEVEFLSHMKYNLYTSKEQWQAWHKQLNKFWTYFDLASKKLNDISIPNSTISFRSPFELPSPPSSSTASPPYGNTTSPSTIRPSTTMPPYLAPSISPANSLSEVEVRSSIRKRSLDETAQGYEPRAKRQHTQLSQQAHPARQYVPQVSQPAALPNLPPLPHSTLPPMNTQIAATQQLSYPSSAVPVAPTSGRTTPASYLPPSNWLHAVSNASSARQMSSSTLQNRPIEELVGQAIRGHSALVPQVDLTRTATPVGSSQPQYYDNEQHSPSHYLKKRSSPFKPVQRFNHLTQAPPSAHMSHYPAQMSNENMVYQPLKKNVSADERRTGPVPYNRPWPYFTQY